MSTNAHYRHRDDRTVDDHIVRLHDGSWDDSERLLTMRGERNVPVIAGEVLPGLDVELLTSFLDWPSTPEAIGGYGEAPRSDQDDSGWVGL
jgi:hypothetical protein